MPSDLFAAALAGASGLALISGPVGCLVLWRGAEPETGAFANAGLLGLGLGAALGQPTAGLLAGSAVAGLAFALLDRLGTGWRGAAMVLGPGLLALALLAMWLLPGQPVDLVAVLLGGGFRRGSDLSLVWLLGAVLLVTLALIWRPLVAAAFDPEMARAEGLPLRRAEAAFALTVALTVALAVMLVGALFAAALLVIPAATARRLAVTPERMAAMASATAVAAVVAGLIAAGQLGTPVGPPAVAAALLLYLIARLARGTGPP